METKTNKTAPRNPSRRNFIKIGGVGLVVTGLTLAGCSDDDDGNNTGNPNNNELPGMRNGVFDFGGGDLGIMTFSYALEQLAAAFYTRLVNHQGFASTFNEEEQEVLTDIYAHEIIHREFFRDLLRNRLPNPDTQLLPNLEFSFTGVNLGDRNAVLQMAQMLEDTGIAAYNGSGHMIQEEENLNLAGKIVSVEGRHASAIRSMIDPDSGNFAPTPLDPALAPSQVIAQINSLQLITTPFSATYLS